MLQTEEVHYALAPTWNSIDRIRDSIKDQLSGIAGDIAEPSMIVASELCENAVKYGKAPSGKKHIDVQLSIRDGRVRITVSNRVLHLQDLQDVRRHIQRIRHANDPAALYVARLKEIMENPSNKKSQLGLYRISYECQFQLACSFHNSILTIVAERSL